MREMPKNSFGIFDMTNEAITCFMV